MLEKEWPGSPLLHPSFLRVGELAFPNGVLCGSSPGSLRADGRHGVGEETFRKGEADISKRMAGAKEGVCLQANK